MSYTRLFQQRVKTRPWSGLKQLPRCWRSVIHTCRSAKISSNVTFCCLSVQSGHHSDSICWRSVIHTHHSAKISSNMIFCCLSVQSGHHSDGICWQSVIHTRPSAKISSKMFQITSLYMPSGAHAHSNPCVTTTLNPPHYARGDATISTEVEWTLAVFSTKQHSTCTPK